MTHVACTTIIHTSADAVWQVIGDFGAACQYLMGVVNCTVEGGGVGARRTLTNADGSVIVERLETWDTAAHQLSFALLTDTPFRDCVTTLQVRDLGPDLAELIWSATFEADGLPADEARDMLEGAFAANCLALKQFMER
ncbi:MAG: SRPBCC family protein [Thermoflexales bacterium]|nr:SRPBCC family protein [Thermoflexales bacterium]